MQLLCYLHLMRTRWRLMSINCWNIIVWGCLWRPVVAQPFSWLSQRRAVGFCKWIVNQVHLECRRGPEVLFRLLPSCDWVGLERTSQYANHQLLLSATNSISGRNNHVLLLLLLPRCFVLTSSGINQPCILFVYFNWFWPRNFSLL